MYDTKISKSIHKVYTALWEEIEKVQIIQSYIFISVRSQLWKFSYCFVLTNETFIADMKSM